MQFSIVDVASSWAAAWQNIAGNHRIHENLWIIWRKIIEVVYATYAVAKRKYCTWLPFRNCISCIYNCDDLPSNNYSLRGSHKRFSYIHNLKIFELFRSRKHFGVNYRTLNPASLAAIKSFTFQQDKQHFQTFWLQVEVLCCLPTPFFRKHDGWKGQGRRSKGHHLAPPQRLRLSKFP